MKVNWWKFGSIAAMAILLFLFGRSCGIKSVVKKSNVITSIKYDTIYLTKDSIIPSKVLPPEIIYKYKKDTLVIQGEPYVVTVDEYCPIDDLNDYNSKKVYIDTSVKGLTIKDTIYKSKIYKRDISLVVPEKIVKEESIFVQPKRIVGYLTLSGSAMSSSIGFSIKNRKDFIYGIGARTDYKHYPQIEFNISLPIKLKK